ncbi:MAG: hypothetical protein AB7O24_04230 [Kofleriaceae bacterium]
MTMPAYKSVAFASGTGDVSPSIGTHAAGDLILVFVATGAETVATPSGYSVLPQSSVIQSANVRGSVFYKFAVSGGETLTVTDPGDHAMVVVVVYEDVDPVHPFEAVSWVLPNTALSVSSLSGVTTDVDDCMIVHGWFWASDNVGPFITSATNSSLANINERADVGTTDGNGSGIAVIDGEFSAAGTIAPTLLNNSGSNCVGVTIALRPSLDYTVSGTVTIDGSPAANGEVVTIVDSTQRDFIRTATIAGGAGGFSVVVPFNDHNYVAVYDDGTNRGASAFDTTVGGDHDIVINTGGGGGGGGNTYTRGRVVNACG